MFRFSLGLFLFLAFAECTNAQSHLDHWYFGLSAGMRFENGGPKVDASGKSSALLGSVSMSDSAGNFLFSSNGNLFYNRDHELMPGSDTNVSARILDVIAMPSTTNPDLYFVYAVQSHFLEMFVVDMSLDQGRGDVMPNGGFTASTFIRGITATKNCYDGGYWLITFSTTNGVNGVDVWKVNPDNGRIQKHSVFNPGVRLGFLAREVITSPNADQIVLAGDEGVFLFDFDPACGKIESFQKLPTPNNDQLVPVGVCYSPNEKHLYITYTKGSALKNGFLYRIDPQNIPDAFGFNLVVTTVYSLRGMLTGPDGRLYILTTNSIGQRGLMDRINNPNSALQNVTYQSSVLEFPVSTNYIYNLPNFVNDKRVCDKIAAQEPEFEKSKFCEGDSIVLKLTSGSSFDSVFLIQRELGKVHKLTSNGKTTVGVLSQGKHHFSVTWKNCVASGETPLFIEVLPTPDIDIKDEELCFNDSLKLSGFDADSTKLEYQENGNWIAQNETSVADEGEYRVWSYKNGCSKVGEFSLTTRDPLITGLAEDEMVFCERAKNAVRLDGGKGFDSYLWYPTNDTTQWIEVKQSGDYYVVVADSRGCIGRGDVKLISDCTPQLFIPNAFTPNGDGINDRFEVGGRFYQINETKIFDRWGERIYYESKGISWDGRKRGELLPNGVYFAIITYSGEFDTEVRSHIGSVHLIR